MLAWPRAKHGAALIDARIYNLGVVILLNCQKQQRNLMKNLVLVLTFGNICLSMSYSKEVRVSSALFEQEIESADILQEEKSHCRFRSNISAFKTSISDIEMPKMLTCMRRFCGVEHTLSQSSTKHRYCQSLSVLHF